MRQSWPVCKQGANARLIETIETTVRGVLASTPHGPSLVAHLRTHGLEAQLHTRRAPLPKPSPAHLHQKSCTSNLEEIRQYATPSALNAEAQRAATNATRFVYGQATIATALGSGDEERVAAEDRAQEGCRAVRAIGNALDPRRAAVIHQRLGQVSDDPVQFGVAVAKFVTHASARGHAHHGSSEIEHANLAAAALVIEASQSITPYAHQIGAAVRNALAATPATVRGKIAYAVWLRAFVREELVKQGVPMAPANPQTARRDPKAAGADRADRAAVDAIFRPGTLFRPIVRNERKSAAGSATVANLKDDQEHEDGLDPGYDPHFDFNPQFENLASIEDLKRPATLGSLAENVGTTGALRSIGSLGSIRSQGAVDPAVLAAFTALTTRATEITTALGGDEDESISKFDAKRAAYAVVDLVEAQAAKALDPAASQAEQGAAQDRARAGVDALERILGALRPGTAANMRQQLSRVSGDLEQLCHATAKIVVDASARVPDQAPLSDAITKANVMAAALVTLKATEVAKALRPRGDAGKIDSAVHRALLSTVGGPPVNQYLNSLV
jgi:hypothetical protein